MSITPLDLILWFTTRNRRRDNLAAHIMPESADTKDGQLGSFRKSGDQT